MGKRKHMYIQHTFFIKNTVNHAAKTRNLHTHKPSTVLREENFGLNALQKILILLKHKL